MSLENSSSEDEKPVGTMVERRKAVRKNNLDFPPISLEGLEGKAGQSTNYFRILKYNMYKFKICVPVFVPFMNGRHIRSTRSISLLGRRQQ